MHNHFSSVIGCKSKINRTERTYQRGPDVNHTLLDISVISTVIYCILPRLILLIPFTVNNCNILCIMGILCDVRPHIQRLTVFFFKLLYTTVFSVTVSLALFYWGHFIFPNFLHLDWHNFPCTMSTALQQLGTDYTGCYIACNDGKIHLSFLSETARARSTTVHQ